MLGESAIRQGTGITEVQRDYGLPDLISDISGDLGRTYLPTNRPAEEWPADAPRTFYYLDRDLAVTFLSGRAMKVEGIGAERRAELSRLMRRMGENASRERDG